ncbi:MAG: Rpn family recombination-promoting nuclease/putative transposase [bacterium]
MEINDKAHNPHDAFFKEVMGRKETASDFFRNYLPREVLKLIDINSLQIMKDSFIEKELKRFYSDILYQVAIGNEKVYLYLLFEHQTTVDKLISFRLLRYMVKVWELEIKQQPGLDMLPPIVPLLLYHGKERWNISNRFNSIVLLGDKEELKFYIPNFTYNLYDFSSYSSVQIKGEIILRVCLELFKHIFDNNLSQIEKTFSLLKSLSLKERSALEFIEAMFRYLMSAREDATLQGLNEIVEKTISSKEVGGVIMTVAEQLIEKGREEGREEGELIGSIKTIQMMKGLPVLDKKSLEKMSIGELEDLFKKVKGSKN